MRQLKEAAFAIYCARLTSSHTADLHSCCRDHTLKLFCPVNLAAHPQITSLIPHFCVSKINVPAACGSDCQSSPTNKTPLCKKAGTALNYVGWGGWGGCGAGIASRPSRRCTRGQRCSQHLCLTQLRGAPPCLLNIWKHHPAACVIKSSPWSALCH